MKRVIKKISIHREGRRFLFSLFMILLVINLTANYFVPIHQRLQTVILLFSVSAFLSATYFFRNPKREINISHGHILAPADGKIVVIEEVYEPEYFKDKRIQVSIFMSPTNVHVNRVPISGSVKYVRYHPGKYLVAWHPKSSGLNERTTIVLDSGNQEIMVRQIAGYLARRIVNYLQPGDEVEQGEELGFIKFGSRIDLFLPTDCEVLVELGQKVKGGKSIIASLA